MKYLRRIISFLLIFSMVSGLLACSKDPGRKHRDDHSSGSDSSLRLPEDEPERVIFYYHYSNYAWGADEYGMCITNKCNVYVISDYDIEYPRYAECFDFCIACLSPDMTLEEEFVNDMYCLACDLDPSEDYIEEQVGYDMGDSYSYFINDDGQEIQFMNSGCSQGQLKGTPDKLLTIWDDMREHIESSSDDPANYNIYCSTDRLRSWTVDSTGLPEGRYSFYHIDDLISFLEENGIDIPDQELDAINAQYPYFEYNGVIFLDIDSSTPSLQSVFFVDPENAVCYFDHFPGASDVNRGSTVISVYLWGGCYEYNVYHDLSGDEWVMMSDS